MAAMPSDSLHHHSESISNCYTMGCPPVRGDNPRALASGLSYIQVDKHGITILPPTSVYTLHSVAWFVLKFVASML